jgi:hypothetical protein
MLLRHAPDERRMRRVRHSQPRIRPLRLRPCSECSFGDVFDLQRRKPATHALDSAPTRPRWLLPRLWRSLQRLPMSEAQCTKESLSTWTKMQPMNLADSLPKPDLDSRLIWAQTRLCEFREGSISLERAYMVWGLLLGWGQAIASAYEGGQYLRIASYFEKDLDHGS